MKQQTVVNINEISNVGELRRLVIDLAKSLAFSDECTGKLAIIANEMSTNILKHAGCSGKVVLRKVIQDRTNGIEIIAIDSGVGIKNMGIALRDGFSTTGSMGAGLGAIKRMSDEFDIYSQLHKGTIVLSRVWNGNNNYELFQSKTSMDYGVFSLAKNGQEVCGDEWILEKTRDGVQILVCDGLGHGEGAAQASREAAKIFKANFGVSLEEMMNKLHVGLKGTRGAVISIADINLIRNKINYMGIGNVSGRIFYCDNTQSCFANEGIVGDNLRKVQGFTYDFPEGAIFIIYTDGFSTGINFDNYPGLLTKKTSIIAALIYRDFSRDNDDMAVVVFKNLKCR